MQPALPPPQEREQQAPQEGKQQAAYSLRSYRLKRKNSKLHAALAATATGESASSCMQPTLPLPQEEEQQAANLAGAFTSATTVYYASCSMVVVGGSLYGYLYN